MDMANFDAEARYAQLGERVDNQGSRITHLEATVTRGFSEVAEQIRTLGNDFRSTNKTPWPVIWSAIGVCFAVFFSLGGALFWPIRNGLEENREEIRQVARSSVSVAAFQAFEKNYELNRSLFRTDYKGDLSELRTSIRDIQGTSVTRQEFDRLQAYIDFQLRQLQSKAP